MQTFIGQHRLDDVRALALALAHYSPSDRQYILQQIEGYQLARTKLPELAAIDDWLWPVRLSMEQCSSEPTAQYKASLLDTLLPSLGDGNALTERTLVDLTGGLGIDAYYMHATDYVERNADLCQLATHNFALTHRATRVHNTEAETYLAAMPHASVIYIDPARRDSHGGKVFRLQDCTPDVTALYSQLIDRCDVLLLKLSPMLDITEALRALPDATAVHIVALRGEVKEVLVLVQPHAKMQTSQPASMAKAPVCYTCVNLQTDDPAFTFTPNAVMTDTASDLHFATELGHYLYEPNAAIMKAGAYREIAVRFGLRKLADNSHLYTSDTLLTDFPGRVWTAHEATKDELRTLTQANILCRNYPLRPEDIKRKYKLRDGGSTYLIGTRTTRPVLLLAERV